MKLKKKTREEREQRKFVLYNYCFFTAGSDSPPCLKISHNTFETMEKANWEFLRLSLPVICHSQFIE